MKEISEMMDDLTRIAGIGDNGQNKEKAAFGLLDTLSKSSKKEDSPQVRYNKNEVQEYVPRVMQGTPAEALIMETGGGTSRTDLGLSSETPIINVPGIDEEMDSGDLDLNRIRQTISALASFFGGRVTWK
jgi:hypothetical protein